MNTAALFGLSILMSFIAFGIVTKLYIWPRIRVMRRDDALLPLVVPHTFRFIGLSFLIPGVVSPRSRRLSLFRPRMAIWLQPCLAVVATVALASRAFWAIPIVWVFNVWGTIDLLHAIYQGQIGARIGAELLGAAFYIPTVVVPALLVTHGLIFWLLLRAKE